MTKVIKNSTDYEEALSEVDRLVARDPAPGAPDADRLELLTLLIQGYESKRVSTRLPDPLEAIRFRMEQQGLTQRDLVPFIGSRSKVSEVLAGKRPLTLSMIRALNRGLGIPAESLLQEPGTSLDDGDVEWDRFPIRDMVARGWVEGVSPRARYEPEDVVRRFVNALGGQLALPALYKKSKFRTGRSLDKHALVAWTFRVAIRARREGPAGRCKPGTVAPDFMREVAQLSWSRRGPLLAQEFLHRHGIALIVEPHLPRTRLDGAAILLDTDRPVIGLTLRYDRLDNFWYALMHEMAHVGLHLKTVGESFCDDLDIEDHEDPREDEADSLAREALVPTSLWNESPARVLRSPEAAQHLAERLRIHPAIVAGRMRFEARNYRILTQLVGRGEVQKLFADIEWSSKE
ncbi:MAG: ImmA/IrrE family metallo-endopeptidase [Candidatus Rokuibacteriota bacterium]